MKIITHCFELNHIDELPGIIDEICIGNYGSRILHLSVTYGMCQEVWNYEIEEDEPGMGYSVVVIVRCFEKKWMRFLDELYAKL